MALLWDTISDGSLDKSGDTFLELDKFILIVLISLVLVAHACNPSYSGGRDQEDQGSKPAGANSLQDPVSIKSITKIAGGMALKV
jgi:hypothetical protein